MLQDTRPTQKELQPNHTPALCLIVEDLTVRPELVVIRFRTEKGDSDSRSLRFATACLVDTRPLWEDKVAVMVTDADPAGMDGYRLVKNLMLICSRAQAATLSALLQDA